MKDLNEIGVIMFGLLGDVLIRTPVLRALKEIYPNAKITAIVDPIGAPLLRNNGYVDELIVVDRNQKNKLEKNLGKIKAILEIRKRKFDLIVNLYNGGSSPAMVFLSNARYKLGFCQQKNRYIYNVTNECEEDRLTKTQSLYSYMISIVEPLSDKKYDLTPIFETKDDIDPKMKLYLGKFAQDLERVYVLNLGASKVDKLLDMDKYILMVEYIYEKYRFVPAIVSNPGQEYLQEDFIDKFVKPKKIPYIKLGPLSLSEIASVVKLTRFISTPDTGLMHLAMALDSYICAIFTYTHPVFVELGSEKFISVYEGFDEGELYQRQDVSFETLKRNVDILFLRLQRND